MRFNFRENIISYSVSNYTEFDLNTALRLWKTKFEDYKKFYKEVITHPALEEFGVFVWEMWDSILPVTAAEAFTISNIEERRVYFDCIGPQKLFKSLNPELLDAQTITKSRCRWKEDNSEYTTCYNDVYELYKIPGEKLFGDRLRPNMWGPPRITPIYAVRCWCTTTAREYWIYVPERVAIEEGKPDAVKAIAWTIRIDITNPKSIMRQGDIIIVEESERSQEVTPYHLSKEQYLSWMVSET